MGISHIPEGREVFEEMTVGENLDLGAFVLRDQEMIRKKLRQVLELFPGLRKEKNNWLVSEWRGATDVSYCSWPHVQS